MSKQKANSDLTSVFESSREAIFRDLNCCRVGIIQEINAQEQTVNVSLVDIESTGISGNNFVPKTFLVGCPLFINKGSLGGVQIPVQIGDECMVIFADRDLDEWNDAGHSAIPATQRKHSLSDGIALVGIRSRRTQEEDYDNTKTILNKEETIVALGDKIHISNSQHSLLTILSDLVTTLSSLTVLSTQEGEIPLSPSVANSLNQITNNLNELLE